MAKKQKDVEFKDMGPDELKRQLEKSQQDLFKLRFRAAVSLKNPMQIRKLRRDIARIHTFLNQQSSPAGGRKAAS